ncbi:MAG: hypothetical protein L6R40_008730, partial [Gallowayella cf. fulva]
TQFVARPGMHKTALMRTASGMSRTIDPRRPRKLNLAQQAEVDRHPEVRLLRRRLKSLLQTFQKQKCSIASTKGTPLLDHYPRAYQAHRNTKRRHKKTLLMEVKERYKKEQPVINIQRQLKGLPVVEQNALQPAEYVFAERVQAIDATGRVTKCFVKFMQAFMQAFMQQENCLYTGFNIAQLVEPNNDGSRAICYMASSIRPIPTPLENNFMILRLASLNPKGVSRSSHCRTARPIGLYCKPPASMSFQDCSDCKFDASIASYVEATPFPPRPEGR